MKTDWCPLIVMLVGVINTLLGAAVGYWIRGNTASQEEEKLEHGQAPEGVRRVYGKH